MAPGRSTRARYTFLARWFATRNGLALALGRSVRAAEPSAHSFRRMPSVNDGPSELPDSGFAATSLLAGSSTSRITLPRVLLVQLPRAQPRSSPQLRVLPVRKPPSSRPWQLLALPPWPLRARPCGRLHAPPSPPPRVARVRQPRSSLSQRLRALPASPPRAR